MRCLLFLFVVIVRCCCVLFVVCGVWFVVPCSVSVCFVVCVLMIVNCWCALCVVWLLLGVCCRVLMSVGCLLYAARCLAVFVVCCVC